MDFVGLIIAALADATDLGAQAFYLVTLFLYAIGAAVALPLPVELLLFPHSEINPLVKALVLGLGKGTGAVAVFYVGKGVNRWLEGWMGRHPLWRKILKGMEWFVRKTGWIGLMVLLAIPFMSDTAVNYFYALLNEQGQAVSRWQFILANVAGGVTRALVFLFILRLAT